MTGQRCNTIGIGRRTVVLAILFACAWLSGCHKELETRYGVRKGLMADKSVNGTRVLGDMFEKAGHTVYSWGRLSPRLRQRADCIVWFPDDFDPPSDKVCDWLEGWLDEKPGRTLIYVGRDFDAAPWYWREIAPQVDPKDKADHQQCLVNSEADFVIARGKIPTEQWHRWFGVKDGGKRDVTTLAGDSDWVDGIDPSQLDIELRSRLLPWSQEPASSSSSTPQWMQNIVNQTKDTSRDDDDFIGAFPGPGQAISPLEEPEVLLESNGDPLVMRCELGDSQIIIVTNGSFLLNLPLVNREHRKLAGKLIDSVGPPDKTVAFLESGPGGPKITDNDPDSRLPAGFAVFCLWPTNWILLHVVVVGILFCFWRFPIFGIPIPRESAELSDFGKHLDAVGELLKQSRNEAYAKERLKQYIEATKPNR
jgi:hypothetical protein